MPSFAEIKAKASKATSTGVGKIQNVRDRNMSVPLKKTNWDPYNGAPPQPPPPRINLNNKPQALAALPPPPSRTGSSIGSRSASSAQLSRTPSTASSAAPPLPDRGGPTSAPPPLPSRTTSLSPPPLPGRGSSVSPASFSSFSPSPPPPPPSRTQQPPSLNAPGSFHSTSSLPPPTNLATKPGLSSVSSVPSPAPAFPSRVPPPRRSPIVSSKSPASRPATESEEIVEREEIDWARLTDEDKNVFFSWLDDFFTRYVGVPVGPANRVRSGPLSASR